MNCEQACVELASYVLGGLDASDGRAVEDHLSECTSCTREHEAYARVTDLMALVRP